MCTCGAHRSEHSDAALARGADAAAKAKDGGLVDSAKVRSRFVQRTCVDCALFELDLDPAAPFGQCVCGEPKAKHSEAALRGPLPRA